MFNYFGKFLIATLLSVCFAPFARADAPVRVLVYGEHQGDSVIYHYTVINNGTRAFNNFVIGSQYDAVDDDTWPELGKLPTGTRFGQQGEVGTQILLDPTSTTQPLGWAPSVYGVQDSGFFFLKWRSSNQVIGPSQTLSGFSVRVPLGQDPNLGRMPIGSDLKYLNGHFSVGLSSTPDLHGQIERQDLTPPSLGLTASPNILWPPNGKLVGILVTVAVRDDYDRAPEVKLESITANEPLAEGDISGAQLGTSDTQFSLAASRQGANKEGRTYTITYSATDGSGNKASQAVRVVVPHDQSK